MKLHTTHTYIHDTKTAKHAENDDGLEELTNIELRENVTILEKSSTSIDTKNSGNRRKCKLT